MVQAKSHRGRFQAQGNGTEESVSWTVVNPISKSYANTSIL